MSGNNSLPRTRHSPDKKMEVVDGETYTYSSAWIHTLESERHWRLYWHQQKMMQSLVKPGDYVLEIGVGSGFTANYLRSKGMRVTTIDIDAQKNPDIIANIATYEFQAQYDHVLAFEVLEHLPFDKVKSVLARLGKVCKQNFFLSVPLNRAKIFHFSLKLPKIKEISWSLTRKIGRISAVNHHWEVGYRSFSRRTLEDVFTSTGYRILVSEEVFSRYLFYTLESTQE